MAQGKLVGDAVRATVVTEVTYYRWRNEYGGLKGDQVKRMKGLDTENSRLRKSYTVPVPDLQVISMNKALSLYLDLVRFMAAMLVFIFHMSYFAGWEVPFVGAYGSEAVIAFFVLSGFVISYTAKNKHADLRDYTLSRLARLWSVVVPAIIVTCMTDVVGQHLSLAAYSPMVPYSAVKWLLASGQRHFPEPVLVFQYLARDQRSFLVNRLRVLVLRNLWSGILFERLAPRCRRDFRGSSGGPQDRSSPSNMVDWRCIAKGAASRRKSGSAYQRCTDLVRVRGSSFRVLRPKHHFPLRGRVSNLSGDRP